ncbi:MAG: ATP-binding cassette domain-containing protein [Streptosporangiales bacterium]|nr:ATP-binding cassette domain-containing protein [Streptosporangiales bacterium]
MSAVVQERTSSTIDATQELSGFAVLRRGIALCPEFVQGLRVTLLLALVATTGRVVIPVAIQRTIDNGIAGAGGPDLGYVRTAAALAAVGLVLTGIAAYLVNVRLFRSSETGLSRLRVRAFRHVHDLSVLTQNAERRGSLVSRVTSDVDQISRFMQFGGLMIVVSLGQLLVATVLMAVYSWQLTLWVWACFLPLMFALRTFQRWLAAAYGVVRARVGSMLGAISEAVVGASVIRTYGIERRTQERVDGAIDRQYRAQNRAQILSTLTFSSSELVAGIAIGGVVVIGVLLGVGDQLTVGQLVAFLFLVSLFVAPVQTGTEVLNEAQNALAGWRRVIAVLDTEPDVRDPGAAGVALPRGPVDVGFEDVSYAYPGGPPVLLDVDVHIPANRKVAVVGETGSGKTTFAKLLTRLMDPTHGRVLLDGVPLQDVSFASLRERVVMVPQDGHLFDLSVGDNIRYGRPSASDAELYEQLTDLGLRDWVDSLPNGLHTPVGERGESLSAGERQLVALARAYLADPDLLVLDEATSAVDPATEVRIQRALDGLTYGRTAVAIAHRLSTAEAADEVLVFDRGVLVERGPHDDLLARGGTYAALYASWQHAAGT